MSQITLSNGRKFASMDGESILDAALRGGISLEHSCRTGRCGSCRTQVVNGRTRSDHAELALSPQERDAGWILSCVRSATSEALEIVATDLGSVRLPSPRTLPCRIRELQRISRDVIKVGLRLPPTSNFDFMPGQYVEMIGHGGIRRSYSVASASSAGKSIDLFIRSVPDGAMSTYWFESAKVDDLLRLHGPIGTFFLRDVAGRDVVFLATGTGIAPVKAMLEGMALWPGSDLPASVRVFWGGRVRDDLFWNPLESATPIEFVPVLSRPDAGWCGERGYVQDALLRKGLAMNRLSVYACGSDAMIHDARHKLLAAGLPEQSFHADAFVCSGVG